MSKVDEHSEIVVLCEFIQAQKRLLVAYRTGNHKSADAALTVIEKYGSRVDEILQETLFR